MSNTESAKRYLSELLVLHDDSSARQALEVQKVEQNRGLFNRVQTILQNTEPQMMLVFELNSPNSGNWTPRKVRQARHAHTQGEQRCVLALTDVVSVRGGGNRVSLHAATLHVVTPELEFQDGKLRLADSLCTVEWNGELHGKERNPEVISALLSLLEAEALDT